MFVLLIFIHASNREQSNKTIHASSIQHLQAISQTRASTLHLLGTTSVFLLYPPQVHFGLSRLCCDVPCGLHPAPVGNRPLPRVARASATQPLSRPHLKGGDLNRQNLGSPCKCVLPVNIISYLQGSRFWDKLGSRVLLSDFREGQVRPEGKLRVCRIVPMTEIKRWQLFLLWKQ